MAQKVNILLTAAEDGGYQLETTERKPDEQPQVSTRWYADLLRATVALTTAKRQYLGLREWEVEIYDAIRNKSYLYPEAAGQAPTPQQYPYNIL
jgi:hypothetical protein